MKVVLFLFVTGFFASECVGVSTLDQLMLMTLAQSSNGAALTRQYESEPKLSQFRHKRSLDSEEHTRTARKGRALVDVRPAGPLVPLYTTTTIVEVVPAGRQYPFVGGVQYANPYGYAPTTYQAAPFRGFGFGR